MTDKGAFAIIGFAVLYIAAVFAFLGGIIYVACHFISKFW